MCNFSQQFKITHVVITYSNLIDSWMNQIDEIIMLWSFADFKKGTDFIFSVKLMAILEVVLLQL